MDLAPPLSSPPPPLCATLFAIGCYMRTGCHNAWTLGERGNWEVATGGGERRRLAHKKDNVDYPGGGCGVNSSTRLPLAAATDASSRSRRSCISSAKDSSRGCDSPASSGDAA
jgi:hypothetical protein